jgi:FAD/FMN-containing dehydrogenase
LGVERRIQNFSSRFFEQILCFLPIKKILLYNHLFFGAKMKLMDKIVLTSLLLSQPIYNFATERMWTNWAGTCEYQIKKLFIPETREEIIHVIQEARKLGKKLKVLGAGHSLSSIAVPAEDGWVISLEKYTKIVNVDRYNLTVTVQAGASLKMLNERLASEGLALESLASTSDITVGGGIQTGTHATGKNYGPIHTQILEMTVINGKGELKTLSARDEGELFRAYQCGLGVLGVIESVTFQLIPVTSLHEVYTPSVWPEVLDHLQEFLDENDKFTLYWYPYITSVGVWTANPSSEPPSISNLSGQVSYERGFLEDILDVNPLDPENIAKFNRVIYEQKFSCQSERTDQRDLILSKSGEKGNVYAAEAAVPFHLAKKFLLDIQKLIESRHLPIHGGAEIRFVKADSAMMSMTFSKNTDDLFCFFSFVIVRPHDHPVPYSDSFDAFSELVEAYQGRLHWGKMGKHSASYLQKIYPEWQKFQTIRNQEDPSGIFLNSWFQELFK